MGALYCLLSMGIFEMKSGCSVEPYYELSSPFFDEITIHLDNKSYNGKQFVIKMLNNSPENDLIQSATLNGKPLNSPRLLNKDVSNGGELTIQLGKEPNKDYWKN